jgi:hypothetical protein
VPLLPRPLDGDGDAHSNGATHENELVLGVQEGDGDGACRNAVRVTAQRTMGGSMDPNTMKLVWGASRAAWMPRHDENNEGEESNSSRTAGPNLRWAHTCRAGSAAV